MFYFYLDIKNLFVIFVAMKKLVNWIAVDGLLHALVSILLTIVFYSFIGFWAVIPTIVIGIGKEIYDILKKPNYT